MSNIVIRTDYGYIGGHEVVMRPSPGVRAKYTQDPHGATTFLSVEEAEQYVRGNGWYPQHYRFIPKQVACEATEDFIDMGATS